MNGFDRFVTPYATLPIQEKARIDLAMARNINEARKHAWEGSMSEKKESYTYTQQFSSALPAGWGDVPDTIEPLTSTSLPVVLAQMVIEYETALLPGGRTPATDVMVEDFNRVLLAAAQPLLTEHLARLLDPPYKVKWDMATKDSYSATAAPKEDDRERREHLASAYEDYRKHCDRSFQNAIPYDAWLVKVGAK